MKVFFVAVVCCAAVLGLAQEEDAEIHVTKNVATLESALKELLKRGALNKLKNEISNVEKVDDDDDKRGMIPRNLCNQRKDIDSWSYCFQFLKECSGDTRPRDHTISYMQTYCYRSCCQDALRKGQLKNCGAPPNVPGGVTTGTDFYQHAKISVRCNSGLYHYAGDLQRTCLPSGQWSGTTPVCHVSVNCGLPPSTGGTVIGTDFKPFKKVDFKCDSDKVFKSGDKVRTCGLNGEWSGTPPVCIVHSCASQTDIANSMTCIRRRYKICYNSIMRTFCLESCCLNNYGYFNGQG